ncbi:MAG: sugar ABC transporter permease [Spirochaetia bacterium]|nr:sugar ABC transporter permease [Spirochaetia bacterium]
MSRNTSKNRSISYARYGLFFVLPYVIVFALFQLYPILYTFVLTFFRWDGLQDWVFIGFKNYRRLVTDDFFYTALFNTLRIWLLAAIPQISLALVLSALFSFKKFKGRGFFQAVFYLPNLITATSIAVLFSILLDWQAGSVNQILLSLHLISEPINWLKEPFWTVTATSYIQWWQWFGYTTLIVMAGMKAIPENLYEAARIDGAGYVTMFFRITIPLLKNTLTYVIVTSIIGGMQIFDVPNVLTGGLGEPNRSILTMVMYLYNTSFRYTNYGYGSTIAYGLLMVIMLFSFTAYKNLQKRGS